MALIKFVPIERKNPKTGLKAWYVRPLLYSRIGKREIIDAAQRNSQIPRAYLEQLCDAMENEIINFVMNGHSITLNGLGNISSRIRSYGAETAAAVDGTSIKKVKFHFRASTLLRKRLNAVNKVMN